MGKPKNRGYKRSWRNLVLDRGYQLRFTLFMVAVSAALMAGLGYFVKGAADKATDTAMNNVLGVSCKEPDLSAFAGPAGAGPAGGADAAGGGEPSEAAGGGDGARRVVVEIESSPVELPPYPTTAVVRYHLCRLHQASTIDRLEHNRRVIFWVLVAAGVLLCIGLAVYGIKMTHRVAGPLHKVKLYFEKMKAGQFDAVYDLRKGDQLVEFYEHFKRAHAGMRQMEEQDAERLRAVLAAADAAGVAEASPEVAAALDELRAILSRKEERLGN